MKRPTWAVLFFAVFSAVASSAVAAESPWELKKNADGIQVSVRKVEGSPILEYKGTVVLDVGLEAAVRLFEEDSRMTEWFHQCSEARLVKTNTPALDSNNPVRFRQELDAPVRSEDKILYFVISMPWPVKDRDLVFRRVRSAPGFGQTEYSHGGTKESPVRSADPVTQTVEYRTSSLPKDYPEQKGKVRMPYLKGLWRFTPLPGGRTEMYYQQHSEVGGHIPAWLVNKLSVNIPFNSLSRFRQLLHTPDAMDSVKAR